jgi:hypothetical protein
MSTTGGQMLTSLPKIKKIVDVITTEGQKFTSLPCHVNLVTNPLISHE